MRNSIRINVLLPAAILIAACLPCLAQNSCLSPESLVADKDGKLLFIALKTANEVAVYDVAEGKVVKRLALPSGPTGLALSPDNARLYATAGEAKGEVHVIDVGGGKVCCSFSAGHGPMAPVVSPDGKTLYVCNRFDNDVSVFDLGSRAETKRIPALREPVAAVLTPAGDCLFVANLLPRGPSDADYVAAAVSAIDTASGSEAKTLRLPNGSTGLRGMAISPDGKHVYVTHLIARFHLPTTQLERGWMNTSALTVIDARTREAIDSVLLDDVDQGAANPWGVACSPDDRDVVVAHAGTHEISVIERTLLHDRLDKAARGERVTEVTQSAGDVPNDLAFLVDARQRIALPGNGPRGVVVVGNRVFAAEYFSGTLAEADLGASGKVRSIPLGDQAEMSVVRRGEMLFNDGTRCFQHWQSCASCHPDARVDGLNWDLLNIGIGRPRNGKSMVLSHVTPPVMSMGVRDKAEIAVRAGFKFIQFAVLPEEDLCAVDEYLKSIVPTPSPRLINGKLSEKAEKGRAAFEKAGCGKCHSGEYFTDNKLHDVGTLRGWEKEKNEPINTPSLIEAWRTGPYLHDGRAVNVRDAFRECDHEGVNKLNEQEIEALEEYVLSL